MAKAGNSKYEKAWYALALARIMVGFVFLWAFFDKLFGWGLATAPAMAWVNGGSPTAGFLQFGVNKQSPFLDFFTGLAGMAWVDWLFMAGLLGIGVALVLGAGLRIAAVAGTVLLVMMWAAEIPLETNPVVDDHLVYAVVIVVATLGLRKLSIAKWWTGLGFVKKNKWLW
jgi:thiosulfate dehydrogenase [quinone] large subunit